MLARRKMESALGTGVDVSATAPRSIRPDARQKHKSIKVRARALKPTNLPSFCGVEAPFAKLRAGSRGFRGAAEKPFPNHPLTFEITDREWFRSKQGPDVIWEPR